MPLATIADKWFKPYQEKLTQVAKQETTWKYVEVSLTLFTIAFFVIFAIRPAVSTISGLVGEIKEKEATSLAMKRKINAIIEAQENYARYQREIGLIDSFLPSDFSLAQGLAQVLGSAGEARVVLETVNLPELTFAGGSNLKARTIVTSKGSNREVSVLKGINFSFSANGDYQRLRQLLNQLVNTRRWIEVSRYRIGLPKEKERGAELRLVVDGRVYFWRVKN